ncbi:hypothetical protein ACFORJ_05070 [Corynebacterium hansenii]|uniref:Secreted protein n=1 Tax=Corynebacterium hansenii TaxID=394964 RepID=A0ABV7ZQK5_9CORY|nr:hypothetical protein [Corynebacterium hansenii]WJZ01306.1 hypothetical protein CHAN_13635 [Corynebacterium hansenii]
MTGRGGRRLVRLIATAAAGALALVAAPVVPVGPLDRVALPDAAAAPPPWPIDPADASVSEQWGAGADRLANRGPLDLRVTAVTPQNPEVGGELNIRLTVSNRSEGDVRDIILRTQRSDPLSGAAGARLAMAAPEQDFRVATSFRDGFDLAAGESREITLSVPLTADAPAGLGIAEPGVYPVLVNANGRPGNDIDQFLAESRMLVPVDSRLDDAAGDAERPGAGGDGDEVAAPGSRRGSDGGPGGAGRGEKPADPAPVSLVWPLAANVPLVPGETGEAPGRPELILANESLSQEMSPGGRLDGLLGALESELAGASGPSLRASTCVAVDPELLDVASRMADGYRVGTERPSPVEGNKRLRDSWGSGDDLDLRKGEGAEAARNWVARLEAVTRDLCVVTLPWSGAELNAVAAANDRELATEALAMGDGVVERVLGRKALPSTIIPPEGYLDAASVPMTAFGDTSAPIDGSTAFESMQVPGGIWPPAAPRTTSLVAANSLTLDEGRIARPGETAELAPGTAAFGLPVPLSSALAATGRSPEVAGYAAVAGRYDLTADSGVARMQTVVGTLRQEISDASVGAGESGAAPIVAMPPAGWSATGEDARALLRAVAATFDDGIAEPVQLGDALARSATDHAVGQAQSSAPNPDPGAVSGTEVSRAAQQSGYLTDLAEMMANDPQVALTRHGFTEPLRRDILRAVTGTGRRNAPSHLDRAANAGNTMAGMGEMLQKLRDSVTLVAPGGVYTRATDMSPVVIVGRNGLPLPVPAYARVQVGDSGVIGRHEAMLPAKGSLTLQVTPENPGQTVDRERQNQLHMWLETPEGQRISAPVKIVARTGPSTRSLIIASVVLSLAVGGFAVWRTRRFDGFRRIRPQWGRD